MAVFQAKAVFQQVVQDQCATLVAEGHARDAAVQMLLARICEGRSERPSEEAISAVVSSHPINRLDAQHALVVKQEIGRLREQGYNVVAAIEEMTAKLQGLATGVGQSSAGAADGGAETARSASSSAAAAAAADDDEGGVGADAARKRPLAAAPSGAPSAKKAKKPAAASAASKSAPPKSPSSPKNKRKTTTTATAASSNTKTAGAGGAAAGMQKRARHSRVKS